MQSENMTGKVVIATLKSWCFISGLSVFAAFIATIIFITTSGHQIHYAMSLLLALCCQYYCWRIWLDCRYFQILNLYPEKSAEFDQALLLIFNKTPQPKTLNDRIQGALRLLKRAAIGLFLQLGLVFLFILVR
ncbi:hypothetical protein Xmau_03389 [Xenorhabdus mauleonii]|uniref:Uncharacterized protein n=1 Tax=Xenorhabdus mauleonii TaxID=351675 RepID=A0A1I3QY44_9GAMM|nr:hypothetical protein [Xenorhabdus mauleonii]PHM38679.1 hypothetical protein Xmau_03389 [Xenorhabdus mauleonii]SFJ38825.1 hypothetical protein SAMN05421680_10870 [Xenorhabdus mauleonii]